MVKKRFKEKIDNIKIEGKKIKEKKIEDNQKKKQKKKKKYIYIYIYKKMENREGEKKREKKKKEGEGELNHQFLAWTHYALPFHYNHSCLFYIEILNYFSSHQGCQFQKIGGKNKEKEIEKNRVLRDLHLGLSAQNVTKPKLF